MNSPFVTRASIPDDLHALRAIVEQTLFPGALLSDMITPFFNEATKAFWLSGLDQPSREVIGVAYCEPEPMTEGTWNLKAIGIDPLHQRRGAGQCLLMAVEQKLQALGARMLVIDTSSSDVQAPARAFYQRAGYDLVGLIPGFWNAQEDKVTFARRLSA